MFFNDTGTTEIYTLSLHDALPISNTIEEIADVFPDHALIKSLGCESCLNLPIVIDGRLRGTLNCLDVAGHYTPERVAAAESLKTAGALAFLLAESIRNQGEKNG